MMQKTLLTHINQPLSPRVWYERFNNHLLKTHYTKCALDSNVYLKQSSKKFIAMLDFILMIWLLFQMTLIPNKLRAFTCSRICYDRQWGYGVLPWHTTET